MAKSCGASGTTARRPSCWRHRMTPPVRSLKLWGGKNPASPIDANCGFAYNGLAFNYINQDGWYMRGAEAGPKAKQAAQKALAIDPNDAGAHLALAIESQWYEWNWAVAESEFKRAIELNPNDAEAHGYYSWFLAPMGRGPEALVEAKRAQQIAPLSSL